MPASESSTATTTRAGLAGAGGGTGVVAIAESLPAGTTRDVLVYLAPTASVIVGAVTFYVEIATKRFLQRRLVASVRARLQEYLSNPATSDEHKAKLVQQL